MTASRNRRLHYGLGLGLMVLIGVAVHISTVVAYPRYRMAQMMRTFEQRGGVNEFVHLPRPTADFRSAVRPSPDLIYSICIFDLSSGPIRIRAPKTGSYMSVSCYDPKTDNFFVMTDGEVATDQFDLILADGEPTRTPSPGVRVINSPSERGLVLLRYFAGTDAEAQRIETARQQARCEKSLVASIHRGKP